ncbi:MAG: hypothetical protein LQ343_003062 [Gyalolechia ehrenbergii]|nr:MAG: hypothetical protein LQ343_003062 [Gyalolechia ehrenbergii]
MASRIKMSNAQKSYLGALVEHPKGITVDSVVWTMDIIWDLPITRSKICRLVGTKKEGKGTGEEYYDVWTGDRPLEAHMQAHLKIYEKLYTMTMSWSDCDKSMLARRKLFERMNAMGGEMEISESEIRTLTVAEQIERSDKNKILTPDEIEESDDGVAPVAARQTKGRKSQAKTTQRRPPANSQVVTKQAPSLSGRIDAWREKVPLEVPESSELVSGKKGNTSGKGKRKT